MNIAHVILFLFFHSTNSFLVPDGLQVVYTQHGEILGQQSSVQFEGKQYNLKTFLGIPYAEPPVGNLRFRKPVPKLKLSKPFRAFYTGSACPGNPQQEKVTSSEDCLYLNIFVPNSRGAVVLPKAVMVWIGGALPAASSGTLNVRLLSAYTDVIIVTVNYRVGPLGFFSTGDSEAPGNYGMWDQHLAMQWVKGNIASFGGDTENITVFGESTGAQYAIFQALYQGNHDVIKRAIAQSGTAGGPGVTYNNTVYTTSLKFASAVGCKGTDHASIVSCLRLKSTHEIMQSVHKFVPTVFDDHPHWVPVYDNDFVVSDPMSILKEASRKSRQFSSYHNIDILIGVNNFAGAVNLPFWMSQFNITALKDYRVTQSQFKFVFVPRVAEICLKKTAARLTREEIIQEYTAWDHLNDDLARLELLAKMVTDCSYYVPMILTANSHANPSSKTYVYSFHAAPPTRLLPLPPSLDLAENSNLADELFFIFGFHGHRPSSDQIKLSKAMMTMWSNFAKSGYVRRFSHFE